MTSYVCIFGKKRKFTRAQIDIALASGTKRLFLESILKALEIKGIKNRNPQKTPSSKTIKE